MMERAEVRTPAEHRSGPLVVDGISSLKALVGEHLGWSGPTAISEEQTSCFQSLTGGSITRLQAEVAVPDYLVLALIPAMLRTVIEVKGLRMAVNYGADGVRFVSSIRTGSAIRLKARLLNVHDTSGGAQVKFECIIHEVGSGAVVGVAQVISQYFE